MTRNRGSSSDERSIVGQSIFSLQVCGQLRTAGILTEIYVLRVVYLNECVVKGGRVSLQFGERHYIMELRSVTKAEKNL